MTRKRKKSSFFQWILAFIMGILTFIIGRSWTEWDITQDTIKKINKHATTLRMEIPLMEEKQGQIIQRTGYTLSYDAKNKTPQWVAWELTKEETRGNEERCTEFFPDPDTWGNKVVTSDYSHSGYDRGHMAPAGDMKWSKKAMQESFYMSNICPQDHNLNTKDWNDLEMKSREWARRFGRIHIVCGPIYNGKRNEYIGVHRIKVPDGFFKVILINTKTKQSAFGFIFENEAGERPLSDYLVSVDKVEEITGLNFFSLLPDDLENRLEMKTLDKLP